MDKKQIKKLQKEYENREPKSDEDFGKILSKYNNEPAKPSEEIPADICMIFK